MSFGNTRRRVGVVFLVGAFLGGLIGGFGHGFGRFNAKFDSLVALQNWVEKGQAPSGLTAMDANQGANRSRPLCEWPKWPKFTGAPGTENSAASYTCAHE